MDFLNDKINKLYVKLLLSALGSTVVTTVYSTVDLICVGQYAGPDGSSAISCINPLWGIMIALGTIGGIGGAVLMNNLRGRGDIYSANEAYTSAFFFSIFTSLSYAVLLNLFMEPLLIFCGARGQVLEYALEYMRPIAVISPTFTMCACISAFVRNDGEAFLPTVATIVGGVINMVCDVLFVFDFGLGLGVGGAGLATATGQVVAFVLICTYYCRKSCKLRFAFTRGAVKKLARVLLIGMPSFISNISLSVTAIVFNRLIVENLSDDHLAVYGTASTVTVLFYCIFYTLGTALQPIASTNHGAGKRERVKYSLRLSAILALAFSVLFCVLMTLWPSQILRIYMSVTDSVLEIGPRIVRIHGLSVLLAGVSIVCTYYFQATLKGGYSLTLSLLRGSVLPVTFAFIIPLIVGYDAIWYSLVVSELITLAVCMLMLRRQGKEQIIVKSE